MKSPKVLTAVFLGLFLALAACAQPEPTATATSVPTATQVAPTATSVPPTVAPTATATPTATPRPTATPTPTPKPVKATLYVLSNPNIIIEIDASTNEVVRRTEVALPTGARWSFNDDINYQDGAHVWLTTRDNNGVKDLEVIALKLDTMTVAGRVKVGTGDHNIFIGKARPDGVLPVANRDLGTISLVDTKSIKLVTTWDVPVDIDANGKLLYKKDLPAGETVGAGKVVCDMDVTVGKDGRVRLYYPTQGNELTIALDAYTGEFLKATRLAAGSGASMLSTHPTDGTVWPQEHKTNTQAVLDPITLEVIARVPLTQSPSINSFSPDGRLSYVTHGATIITVVDTQSYKVVATVQAGTNANQVAAHPNGKTLYIQVNREASVAVVDTSTWEVIKRIPLGTNPNGLFIRTVS